MSLMDLDPSVIDRPCGRVHSLQQPSKEFSGAGYVLVVPWSSRLSDQQLDQVMKSEPNIVSWTRLPSEMYAVTEAAYGDGADDFVLRPYQAMTPERRAELLGHRK